MVVPGLIASADLPLLSAVGSSLVSVTAFGLTATNHALAGLIDRLLVLMFVTGGASLFGRSLAGRLANRTHMLARVFAAIVASVSAYGVARGLLG